MKISTYALAVALGGLTLATPAIAQQMEQTKNTQTSIRSSSGSAASKSEEKPEEKQQTADKLSSGRQLDLSKEARKAIVELQPDQGGDRSRRPGGDEDRNRRLARLRWRRTGRSGGALQ